MMKKTLFLESNKSRILVRRDSKRCFFPIVSLYFVRLNHHYITSMTAYPVAFPTTVVVLHIGVRTLSPPVSFPAKTCVYLVNVLTVMLCA